MRVALVGYGTMGQIVEKKLLEKGHEIAGIVSLGMDEDLECIKNPFDVIIDFSHPSFLDMILTYVKKHNTPLVVATTGYNEEQIASIKECAKAHPIVYTANFSLGVTVFEEVLKQITPILKDSFDIEVIEKRQGLKVACLEGIALRKGWITADKMRELAQPMLKNQYGQYLLKVIKELGLE